MVLATYPLDLEHAVELTNNGVLLLVGNDKFATRIPVSFQLKDIQNMIESGSKVEVLVNNLIHEFDILDYTNYLKELKAIGVKKIRIGDVGIIQICKDESLDFDITYDPEMLVTTYGTFDFWLSHNVKQVSVARELFPAEIAEIGERKGNMQLSIQVHGHQFMMQSKRPLISNYKENFKYDFDSTKPLEIKEENRKESNLIYEDKNGTTNMFTGYDVCAIKKLDILAKYDTLVINNIFHTKEWTDQVLTIWNETINQKISQDEAFEKLAQLSKIGEGFFNPLVNVYEHA